MEWVDVNKDEAKGTASILIQELEQCFRRISDLQGTNCGPTITDSVALRNTKISGRKYSQKVLGLEHVQFFISSLQMT